MIRRKSKPYNYGRKPEPMPKPEDKYTLMQKVKHLPKPGPGIMIRIPLHLYPLYMELYGLEEKCYRGDTMFYVRTKKAGTIK